MSTESRELLDNWARHYSISPSAMEALHSVLSTREALAHSRAQDSGGDVYNIPAAQALISAVAPGFRVIYRDAFRWKDEHGHVLPNHYECQDAPYLAEEHGHDMVLDLGFAAILRDKRAAEQPAKGEGEYPRDVAMLLDSNAWTVHPESMSHDEAGSLWVWAQDAAAALRKYATPQPSDPSDAEKWGQQYRCGCFLGFPTKRAIPASCPQHMRDKQGGALPLDATPPTAQRHDAVQLERENREGWKQAAHWREMYEHAIAAHGAGAAVEAVDAFGRTGPLLKGWDRLAREEGRPGHSRLTWAQAAADLRQVQMRNAALSTQPLLSDQPGGVDALPRAQVLNVVTGVLLGYDDDQEVTSEAVRDDIMRAYDAALSKRDDGASSLLRKPGSLPAGCFCRPGRCMAPIIQGKQMPCRDPEKAALHPEQAKDGDVSNDNR